MTWSDEKWLPSKLQLSFTTDHPTPGTYPSPRAYLLHLRFAELVEDFHLISIICEDVVKFEGVVLAASRRMRTATQTMGNFRPREIRFANKSG